MVGDGSRKGPRSGTQAFDDQSKFDFVLLFIDIEYLCSQWIDVDSPKCLLDIGEVILVAVQEQHKIVRPNLEITQLAGVLAKSVDSNGVRQSESIMLDVAAHDHGCAHTTVLLSTMREA
jgi:hypothetical protein